MGWFNIFLKQVFAIRSVRSRDFFRTGYKSYSGAAASESGLSYYRPLQRVNFVWAKEPRMRNAVLSEKACGFPFVAGKPDRAGRIYCGEPPPLNELNYRNGDRAPEKEQCGVRGNSGVPGIKKRRNFRRKQKPERNAPVFCFLRKPLRRIKQVEIGMVGGF